MKKSLLFLYLLIFSVFGVFAQINNNIPLENEIYDVLENLQIRGLCSPMIGQKPYTQRLIFEKIDESLSKEEGLSPSERDFLEMWKQERLDSFEQKPSKLSFHTEGKDEKIPTTVNFKAGLEASASGGLYTKNQFDQWGFDVITKFDFFGDISRSFSYRIIGYFDLTQMPLYTAGNDYLIGYDWYDYDNFVNLYCSGQKDKTDTPIAEPRRRTIKTLLNTSYLPFSYSRLWDGQMYYLSNFNASGLEGWPQQIGFSGGIQADLHYSALNGKIELGAGRYKRAYASMDNGSSLVLNESARPFFGIDMAFNPVSWIQYSFVAGGLEYPNQDYMNADSYPGTERGLDDSFFFQNGFTLNMIEVNLPFFHFDFGSSAIWPKRIELGYLFPLANYVEYQNHIGDGDNLALFGDLKFKKTGLGEIWASCYLEELNLGSNFFTDTRVMFAGQMGTKIAFPFLPFSNISLRYTKVEPFCYTHQSINYSPWYNHYIWESYTNAGESLGYYLPPNADEFLVKFDARPLKNLYTGIQYQFIRHGADYGSQQVAGSSLYSELTPWGREKLHKYFLHDGAYNWMHIVNASFKYTLKNIKVPLEIFGSVGFMYSYYTVIDSSVYKEHNDVYGEKYQNAASRYTPYHFIDSEEYPVQCGGVLTLGVKLFHW